MWAEHMVFLLCSFKTLNPKPSENLDIAIGPRAGHGAQKSLNLHGRLTKNVVPFRVLKMLGAVLYMLGIRRGIIF